jgi:hypothetical protein
MCVCVCMCMCMCTWMIGAAPLPVAGELIQLELQLSNSSERALQLELTLACLDLAESSHSSSSIVASPRSSQSALAAGGALGLALPSSAPAVHPGVVLAGWTENVALTVEVGATVTHKFAAVMVQPGFYQLYVTGVRQVGEGDIGDGKASQRLQVTMDPLNVLCV